MSDSNPPANTTPPRVTLKLKAGTKKPTAETKTQPTARPQPNPKQKPGAHWSDEYKERMQADMDALQSR
jgi:hypothetical protein